MTVEQVKQLKNKIKLEMLRRNGHGSLSVYGGTAFDFSIQPTIGQKTNPEYGQKTIDLILKIEDFKDLKLTKLHEPIPAAFSNILIQEVNRLSNEKKTGESIKTVTNLFPARTPETSSCRGACTGLCVGSCISNCNGCTGCTATCGTGCASSCNTGCQGLTVAVGS